MRQIRNRRGQGLVEYLILVALIAVGSIAVLRVVGQSVTVQYSKVAKALGAKVDGDPGKPSVTSTMYKKRDLGSFIQGAVGSERSSRGDD